ncbi:glycine betaine ABC transporter substrate-binding protein [Feifania hominis]|uniref:Glycine/betaine ABC transporter substrate-binding protein n=1 Tax=Feifania hominis TaxID=2763660 RepID=A0A926DCL5_9FIRM|nr:glycine betaine ABC transporter substrate-binding protein [Feifania hominis]MBC8535402.1 glycine/betaine ABC transporter substrate-binding protein [Feifania hominis]
MKKTISLLLCVLLLAGVLAGCGSKGDKIIILDGEFAEPELVAEMAKLLIEEHTDLKAEIKDAMSPIYGYNEMNAGKIDLMLSYDGSLLVTFMKKDDSDVPEGMTTYDYANEVAKQQTNVYLLDKLGLNNTYQVAVRQETADKYNLETVSDLVAVADELVFGAEHKFFDEESSIRYKPLCKFYNLNFKEGKSVDLNLKYSAMESGNIDVTVVYATDGLNAKANLKILKDDKGFFPDYNGAILVRKDLFDDYRDKAPNLEEVLNMLGGQFTDESMAQLSYEVDVNGRSPEEVAREFLVEKGLIES